MAAKFGMAPPRHVTSHELVTLCSREAGNFSDLYIVHVTCAGRLKNVLSLDPPWLEARKCTVFKDQERLYFFVMRPLYRLPDGDAEQTLLAHFPVAIVMKAEELGVPAHVAPFDTGAAVGGRYDDCYSPGAFLQDYMLGVDIKGIKKFLQWSYGDATNYFRSNLRLDIAQSIPNFMSVAHSWLQIAMSAAPSRVGGDLRGAAVEVAYGKGVPLAGHTKLLVVPDELLQDTQTRKKNSSLLKILEDNKLRSITKKYKWKRGARPNEHLSDINGIVHHFLMDQGVFTNVGGK